MTKEEGLEREINRLRSNLIRTQKSHDTWEALAEKRGKEVREVCDGLKKYEIALESISALRDCIIAHQSINWSAHVYPLVKILNEAGFEGLGYEEAKKKAETIHEHRERYAEALRRARKWADDDGTVSIVSMIDRVLAGGPVWLPPGLES